MMKSNAIKRNSGCRDQLLRAIAECFARLGYGPGVCPSVRLSVRHTAVLCQNGAS